MNIREKSGLFTRQTQIMKRLHTLISLRRPMSQDYLIHLGPINLPNFVFLRCGEKKKYKIFCIYEK